MLPRLRRSTNSVQYVHESHDLENHDGAFPQNEGIYCREWDLLNPRVYRIVHALVDEIVDAGFDADALHVGMEEVFLIGNDASPSTKGKDPAEMFAKAVNDMYAHVVKKRGLEMLMWGDRLIDASRYDYGEWESSKNHTWPAIYMIPRDIIIADWHYEPRDSYPSIPLFLEKGFRVLPTSWKDVEASRRLIEYGRGLKHARVLGHLFTSWAKLEKPRTDQIDQTHQGPQPATVGDRICRYSNNHWCQFLSRIPGTPFFK